MIDFPASPINGQVFNSGGKTWTFDGTKWVANVTTGFLPLSGGTMSGDIVLKGDPTAALNPVSLQYLNARPMIGDNRIINGDMRLDQRQNGASGTAVNVYTVDRWQYFGQQAAKGTWQRSIAGGGLSSQGFGYSLGFTSSSAYTPLANDYFCFAQPVEADMVSDFAWGTAGAQSVTLSFWAMTSLTGPVTFGGCVANYAATRCYPFTYSLPIALTWTKITVTIPGDTAGAWVMSGNAGALYVYFDLGSGASRRGLANAWATTTSPGYIGATGSVSVVATNGATFNVTGVKLEIGSVATPFNRQSLAKSLIDCQRYYEKTYNATAVPGSVGAGGAVSAYVSVAGASYLTTVWQFKVTKRTTPAVTIYNPNTGTVSQAWEQNTNANLPAMVIGGGESNVTLGLNGGTVAAIDYVFWHATASAEL